MPPDTGSSGAKRRNPRTTMPSRAARRGRSGAALDRRRRAARRAGPPGPANGRRRRAISMRACCSIDPCEPAAAPQLGFVAGLALHEAVEFAHRNRRAAPVPEMAERPAARRRQDRRASCSKATGSMPDRRSPSSSASASTSSVAPIGTPYPATTLRECRPRRCDADALRGAVDELSPAPSPPGDMPRA